MSAGENCLCAPVSWWNAQIGPTPTCFFCIYVQPFHLSKSIMRFKSEHWMSSVGVDVFLALADICAECVHVWFCWVPLDGCSLPCCRLGVLCLSSSSPSLPSSLSPSLPLSFSQCLCGVALAIKATLSRGRYPAEELKWKSERKTNKTQDCHCLPLTVSNTFTVLCI